MRRLLTSLLALGIVLGIGGVAAAQDFPRRTLTIIAPASAGGGTDLTARNLGRAAEAFLGQSVIVKDMPGGGNAIGITAGYQADPDGYTLVLGQVETVLLPLMGRVSWKAQDFTPILGVNRASSALTVKADSPYMTAKDFIEHAKMNPGLKVGGSAPGTIWHLAAVGFEQSVGADFNVIPYSGGAAPAIQDLLGGQLDAITVSAGEVSDQADAGLVRILCLMSPQRDTVRFPDLPTCAEEGYDVSYATWWALMAPPNTPADVAAVLQADFQKAWNTDEFQKFLSTQGLEPMYVSPGDFPAFVAAQSEKFKPVLEQVGLLQ